MSRMISRSMRFLLSIAFMILLWKSYTFDMEHIVNFKSGNSANKSDNFCLDTNCTRSCHVELKGYSNTNTEFYIKVNEKIYASPEPNGLLLITMIPGAVCKVTDWRLMTSDNSMTLARYFGSLPLGSVVFGASGGGVPEFLHEASGYMKTSLTISLPSNFNKTDTLLFKAMKGHAKYAEYVVNKETWQTELPLISPLKIDLEEVTIEEVESHHPDVTAGKGWTPETCKPLWKLAIIIPFRDRQQHLHIFLNNFLNLLKKQLIQFHVFVLEQTQPELFNRAALMNVGYLEAQKIANFDCFAFHDVDHIPEDVCNMYSCSDQPRHLSVAKDINNYKLVYHTMFGGASLLSTAHIQKINGFPNTFFGWGGEDDNMFSRLHNAGYKIARYPSYIARYTTIPHKREHKSNPKAGRGFVESLETARLFWKYDGLNSVNYTVANIEKRQLFTKISVQLPGPVNAEEEEEYFEHKMKEFMLRHQQDKAKITDVETGGDT